MYGCIIMITTITHLKYRSDYKYTKYIINLYRLINADSIASTITCFYMTSTHLVIHLYRRLSFYFPDEEIVLGLTCEVPFVFLL